jgi:hypothetical protein
MSTLSIFMIFIGVSIIWIQIFTYLSKRPKSKLAKRILHAENYLQEMASRGYRLDTKFKKTVIKRLIPFGRQIILANGPWAWLCILISLLLRPINLLRYYFLLRKYKVTGVLMLKHHLGYCINGKAICIPTYEMAPLDVLSVGMCAEKDKRIAMKYYKKMQSNDFNFNQLSAA